MIKSFQPKVTVNVPEKKTHRTGFNVWLSGPNCSGKKAFLLQNWAGPLPNPDPSLEKIHQLVSRPVK